MKTTQLTLILVSSLSAAALLGCGGDDADPADPDQASARIQATLPALSEAMDQTFAALESERFADLDLLLDTVLGGSTSSDGGSLAKGLTDKLGADELDGEGGVSLDALADELFTADNYDGNGEYLVPPALLCGDDDPECAEQVAEAELRVRAVLAGDGLDMTLLVGPDRDAPLVVELRSESVAGTVDLGEAADAAVFLASLTGESIELPSVFDGQIRGAFELIENGARASLSIPEDIEIAGAVGEQDVSVQVGASDPLYALTVDFAAPSVAIDIDLGPVNLQLPWTLIDDEASTDDTVVVDWKGASASVVLDSDDRLQLTNLGLGDGTSSISVDGVPIVAIDINKDSGRRFDLTLTAGAQGPRIELDPGLDVEVYVDLAVVDAEAPAHLSGVTYRTALTGSQPTIELVDTGFDTLVHIVSGALTIDASDTTERVMAVAGDCLASDLEAEPTGHPVLGTFATVTCPATSR